MVEVELLNLNHEMIYTTDVIDSSSDIEYLNTMVRPDKFATDNPTKLSRITVPIGNWILRRFSLPDQELSNQIARTTIANPDVVNNLKKENKANPELVERLLDKAEFERELPEISNVTLKMPVKMPETLYSFHVAFENRFRQYVPSFVFIILAVSGLDYLLAGNVPNQFLGLMIEVFGAAVLGRGLVKSPYQIAGEMLGYNTAEVLTSDMVDGMFGLFFLAVGVLTQLAAIVGVGIPYRLLS